MSEEWEYISREDDSLVWGRCEDLDPYGSTHEVMLNSTRGSIAIRVVSNDRAPNPTVTQAAAPIEVVVEVLKRAGWLVTPPKKYGP